MGDKLGDVTGIVDFDFTDRKLFVTNIDAGADRQHGSRCRRRPRSAATRAR
jgi:hypothetical protein